jgi:hypothetical protein
MRVNNDSDDEDDDNDVSIDHNTLRNEMVINETRPSRIWNDIAYMCFT